MALGYKKIPAIVVEVSKEERLLRSLVENAASRFPVPADLLREIERLKAAALQMAILRKKLGISESYVSSLMTLEAGRKRKRQTATLNGKNSNLDRNGHRENR